MKLSTVNVIVQDCEGVITKLFSFGDSPEGVQSAEEIFSKQARRLGCADINVNSYMEDGMYENGQGYKVIICHSTN